MESRTQGSRPRPRTQKNFEAKVKDRPYRGRAPRTQTQMFSKKKKTSKFFSGDIKKKKVFKNVFQAKKVFKNFFSGDFYLRKSKKGLCRFSARFLAFSNKISTVKKRCCPRAENRAIFEDLRLRGQGQNVSSKPRTSSRTPPLVATSRKKYV